MISISLFSKGEQKSKCRLRLSLLFIEKIISATSSVFIFSDFVFKKLAYKALGLPNKCKIKSIS